MYSEHGLDALIRPVFGHVCQSLIVVSYWMPGSAQRQAASAISFIRSRALSVSIGLAGRARDRLPLVAALDGVA